MNERTRRDFLRTTTAAGIALFVPAVRAGAEPAGTPKLRDAWADQRRNERTMRTLYIGTYTHGDSEGIYHATFDGDTGAIDVQGVMGPIEHPSFVAVHPSGNYLYAVSETSEFGDTPGGGVYAYAIGTADGTLTELNAQPSRGGAPCYITVTPDGRHVLVANYTGGNVSILPIQDDGRLGPPSDVQQHEGSGPNEARQQEPHAHCIVVGPSGDRAFAADLGIDRIVGYRIRGGELVPDGGGSVAPGAGPRHFVFHPDGRRAYVINELDSTITAFTYDDGDLEAVQTIGTLPNDYEGENHPADIHVSRDGRFLYGSNRGHDSIVVLSIHPETGALDTVQHVKTGGRTPRNFTLDPSGRYLLAANQRSDTIVVFDVDPETGRLDQTDHMVRVPSPVCLKFHPST